MEVLLKVLHFLCLLSLTICVEFAPTLNIKRPLNFLLNNINPNINKLNNPDSQEQCFCVPKNAKSGLVLNHLGPINENLQRVVLYLYKNDGEIKVYVPNKHKQKYIPDLYFDVSEGDILKTVTSASIAEIFDDSPNIIKSLQSVIASPEGIVNKETTGIEPDEHQQQQIKDEKQLNEDNEHKHPKPSEGSIKFDHNNHFNGENIPIDITITPSNQVQSEIINNLGENQITQHDANHLHSMPPILLPNLQTGNQHGVVNNPNSNQLLTIPSVLPPKSQLYLAPPMWQNPYSMNSKITNKYISFYDWFEDQLSRVVLYSLETPSKINQLRERIKKVLENNGIYVGYNGVVTYLNGNLVEMSNIKLRPILIGDQVEYHQPNTEKSIVSYAQFIEIILITPPKLLGTLMMGTVYLPRNVSGLHKINVWNNHQYPSILQNGHSGLGGCPTCKINQPSQPYSILNNALYPHVTGIHGVHRPAYGMPFRKKINTENENFMGNAQEQAMEEMVKQSTDDDGRSGLGGVFDGLLGNLGISQTIFSEPTRRLLDGVLPNRPKPGPIRYPNDALPGFRIIGGNPATSSGTPLVSRGRSGFQNSFSIV